MRPLQGECLIEMVPAKEQSDGGILIPVKFRERSEEGIVKRIGKWDQTQDGRAIPPDFKVGDRVVVNEHVGRWLHGGTGRSKLVPVRHVLAVLTNPAS